MILKIIRFLNHALTLMVSFVLICTGAYACYALWDNHQVYQAAEDVRADMLRLKPSAEGEGGPSFEELLKINPDVCAWITMDNTRIDYPVLQGEDNMAYINTDVYGDFALAGSIFLDSRCDREFDQAYSLLYGHHMENGSMFGDLDLYKEEKFFRENRTGTLLLPAKVMSLQTMACLLAEASDDKVFETDQWQEDIPGFLDYVRENALYCEEELLDAVEEQERAAVAGGEQESSRILVLSTCSSEFTNARTILITLMQEEGPGRGK